LPRLFFSFCLGSGTEAYWGEAKRYPLLASVVTRSHKVSFMPRVHENRSHKIKIFFLIKFFAAQIWKSIFHQTRTRIVSSRNTRIKQLHPCNEREPESPIPVVNPNQNSPSMNHHCRSDEREPPLQAIIDAAATNDEKTGRAHQEPWTRERWWCRFTTFVAVTVAFCSGGDLDGGSSSGVWWRSRERCCHGGSRRRVADLVPCFRVAVVAGAD